MNLKFEISVIGVAVLGSLCLTANPSPAPELPDRIRQPILDRTYAPEIALDYPSWNSRLLLQQGGKVVMADFSFVEPGADFGEAVPELVRFNADGTRDHSFRPPKVAGWDAVVLGVDAAERIYVFGALDEDTGPQLFRLNAADGSLDPAFEPFPIGFVTEVAFDHHHRVLVLPDYGPPIRLLPSGMVDETFAPDISMISDNQYHRRIAITADNKMLLIWNDWENQTGTFTSGLLRLDENGRRDPTFHEAEFRNTGWPYISSLEVQNDGKILVAGTLQSVNGVPRRAVARLHPDGTLDEQFDTDWSQDLDWFECHPARDPAGRLWVLLVSGRPWRGNLTLYRLHEDGSIAERFRDLAFMSASDGIMINSVQVQSDGRLLLLGAQYYLDGYPVSRVVRLHGRQEITVVEFPERTFGASEADGVATVVLERLGDLSLPSVVRLKAEPGTAEGGKDFDPETIRVQFAPGEWRATVPIRLHDDDTPEPDKTIQLTLDEAEGLTPGMLPRNQVRITDNDSPGSVDGTFPTPPLFNNQGGPSVDRIHLLPGGRLLLQGTVPVSEWGEYPEPLYRGTLRLHLDGSLDGTFRRPTNDIMAVLSDGSMLVPHQEAAGSLLRLNPDGEPDPGFLLRLPAATHFVTALSSAHGSIVALLATGNGTGRTVYRFLPDGSQDPAFTPWLGSALNLTGAALLLSHDGQPVIAHVGFSTRQFSALRLLSNGGVDPTFASAIKLEPGSGSSFILLLQPDGKILVAGDLHVSNGDRVLRNLFRLLPDGTLDPQFVGGSGIDGRINALAIDAFGRVLVGGRFHRFHGAPVKDLVRLNPDGTFDPTFNPRLEFTLSPWRGGSGVKTLFPLSNGQLLVGGNFTHVNGLARMGLVRLNGAGQAQFTQFASMPDGRLHLEAAVEPLRRYRLETSANFQQWSTLETTRTKGTSLNWRTAITGGEPGRFFRIVKE